MASKPKKKPTGAALGRGRANIYLKEVEDARRMNGTRAEKERALEEAKRRAAARRK